MWPEFYIVFSHIFLLLSLHFTYERIEKLWIEFVYIFLIAFWYEDFGVTSDTFSVLGILI